MSIACATSSLLQFVLHQSPLASLVHAERDDMRVQHRRVERCDIEIQIRQHDRHSAVDDAIVSIYVSFRLVAVSSIVARCRQRRVRQVQLVAPSNPSRLASSRGSDVGVVGSDSLAGRVPVEKDLLAWEGERLRLVMCDGWTTAVIRHVEVLAASGCDVGDGGVGDAGTDLLAAVLGGVVGGVAVDVGVVEDVEDGEVLPCQTSLVLWAVADVC